MRTQTWNCSIVASLLLVVCSLALHTPTRADGGPILVVIQKSAPINSISMADLRRAFLGLPTEVAGMRLLPLNQRLGAPARVRFDQAVMDLSPDRVGAFWVDRRIRDQSPPPRSVPSEEFSAKVVASLPGAITYVPPNMLNPKIKALRIDDAAADSPNYPLR